MVGICSYGGYVPRYRLNRMIIFEAMGWMNPATIGNAKGEKAVLLSLAEFNSWQETIYLLSNPANADHLQRSITEARSGNVVERELIDA